MKQELEQVSIKFAPEERAVLERIAAAEHRSLSAQVRHLAVRSIEDALRTIKAQSETAA